MKSPEARELGILQARDHPENARLLAVLQLGLEANHVPQRAKRVVLPQLHDGMRTPPGARIVEADGLHRSEAERVVAALGHDFDRQAPFEVWRRGFPILEDGFFAGEQRIDEVVVFRLRHRAVEIVGARASRPGFVIARLAPDDGVVDAVAMHDGSDGVEERERPFTGEFADRGAQAGRGQRSRRDNDAAPTSGGQPVDFSGRKRNERI